MEPDLLNHVVIVAVGFGSSQTAAVLNEQKEARGYPGIFAEGPDSMARDFSVRTQSTKLGMTADGVIRFKEGYGLSPSEVWRERLRGLVEG